jgi:alanine racemase
VPAVRGITLMTHFARADDEVGVAGQLAASGRSARARLPGEPGQLGGAAALPEAAGQLVRPGIMLYGGSPMPDLQSAEASACAR